MINQSNLYLWSLFITGSIAITIIILIYQSYTRRLPPSEEWKRTAYEMGFDWIGNKVFGKYRNHNVTIDEINEGSEGDAVFQYYTRYRVDFENPKMILLHIRRGFPHTARLLSSLEGNIQNIHISDPQFEGLVIRGNRENDIKTILDSSIRSRLMKIKVTLFDMEIGYGKHTGFGFSHKVEIIPNVAHYIDTLSFPRTRRDPEKFQFIVDTLIDIVERIESYTPSV